MTIEKLLALCADAEKTLAPPLGSDPVTWLSFRRAVGPVEVRLLLEAHRAFMAAVGVEDKEATRMARVAARVAHQAVATHLEALPLPPALSAVSK